MAISAAADSERETRKSLKVDVTNSKPSGRSLHGNMPTDVRNRELIEEI